MKKYGMLVFVCLAGLTGFSQQQTTEKNTAPATTPATASADSSSTYKNLIVAEPRKKKEKRARNKKECSRMKS